MVALTLPRCRAFPLRGRDGDWPDDAVRHRRALDSLVPSWPAKSGSSRRPLTSGYLIAPGASLDRRWSAPLAKAAARSIGLAARHLAPSILVAEQRRRAVLSLGNAARGYVCPWPSRISAAPCRSASYASTTGPYRGPCPATFGVIGRPRGPLVTSASLRRPVAPLGKRLPVKCSPCHPLRCVLVEHCRDPRAPGHASGSCRPRVDMSVASRPPSSAAHSHCRRGRGRSLQGDPVGHGRLSPSLLDSPGCGRAAQAAMHVHMLICTNSYVYVCVCVCAYACECVNVVVHMPAHSFVHACVMYM